MSGQGVGPRLFLPCHAPCYWANMPREKHTSFQSAQRYPMEQTFAYYPLFMCQAFLLSWKASYSTNVSWMLRNNCVSSQWPFPGQSFENCSSARHSLIITVIQTSHSLSVLIWKFRYFPCPELCKAPQIWITSLHCSQFKIANVLLVITISQTMFYVHYLHYLI